MKQHNGRYFLNFLRSKIFKKRVDLFNPFFSNHKQNAVHRFFGYLQKQRKKLIQSREYKLFSNRFFIRILIICFFLGVNIQLVPFFLQTNSTQVSQTALAILDFLGIVQKESLEFSHLSSEIAEQPETFSPLVILEKLNTIREENGLQPLEQNEKLASVAAELLDLAEANDLQFDNTNSKNELESALKKVGYTFAHVGHSMVVGPASADAVLDVWLSKPEESTHPIFAPDFIEVGFATKIVTTKQNETLGVTVQILGISQAQANNRSTADKTTMPIETATLQKQKNSNAQTQNESTKKNATNTVQFEFPPISSSEVFTALNAYRESHGLHRLQESASLCTYAQKRVGDLIAFGSLDNHAGFKADFADPEQLPSAIREYRGKKIAENLAYQHCRNMKTQDAFIAETGTALIEWCFDSSTAGHREAQLSREFSHACVGSGEGFFVIIFGAD